MLSVLFSLVSTPKLRNHHIHDLKNKVEREAGEFILLTRLRMWANPYSLGEAGYRIPMLGDRKQEEEPVQVNFQAPEQYIEYPDTDDGLDWSIIVGCSVEQIVENDDVSSIERVLQAFIKAKFTKTDSSIITNPLAQKLFRLLQIGFTYIMDCQKQLQIELDKADEEVDILKRKNAKKHSIIKNLKEKLDRPIGEKCVVCGHRFKNLDYLDKHFNRRHQSLAPAWISLRSGEMHGVGEIMDEIDRLREAIGETHKDLTKRVKEQEVKVARAPRQTEAQVKLMEELKANQEKLIEKTNTKENEQEAFMQNMRQQLDEAVIALQRSHERWAEQKLANQPPRVIIQQQPEQPSRPLPPKQVEEAVIHDLNTLIGQQSAEPESSIVAEPEAQNKDEEIPDAELTLQEMMRRASTHADVLARIDEIQQEEELTVTLRPNEDLIRKAKEYLNRLPRPIDEDQRATELSQIEKAAVNKLKLNCDGLAVRRKFKAISPQYIRREMLPPNNASYQKHFDFLLDITRKIAPMPDTTPKFEEPEKSFPYVPPLIDGPVGKTPNARPLDKPNLSMLPQAEVIREAKKKLPYSTRHIIDRGIYLPDESDIDIVSSFGEEVILADEIAPEDDPDFIKRRKAMLEKAIREEEATSTSTMASENDEDSTILPLSTAEMKELEIDSLDFASSDNEGIDMRKTTNNEVSDLIFGEKVDSFSDSSDDI